MARIPRPKQPEERVSLIPPTADKQTSPTLPEPTKPEVLETPVIHSALKRIGEYYRKIDPVKTWDNIREFITNSPDNPAETKALLKQASGIVSSARDLLIFAQGERSRFMLVHDKKLQVWRGYVTDILSKQKASGELQKMITNQMVDDEIINFFESDYSNIRSKKDEMDQIVDSIESIINDCIGKQNDLRKILDSENRRSNVPNWLNDEEKK